MKRKGREKEEKRREKEVKRKREYDEVGKT